MKHRELKPVRAIPWESLPRGKRFVPFARAGFFVIMKMTDEQKALAKVRRAEKKAARRMAWMEELAKEELRRNTLYGSVRVSLAEERKWQRCLFLAAALIQEAHAGQCEAALANDGAVFARAAAANDAARKSVERVGEMLMPIILGNVVWCNSESEEKAHVYAEQACAVLVDFPRSIVSRIPSWGDGLIERHRKRRFGSSSGVLSSVQAFNFSGDFRPESAMVTDEQSLPTEPEVLRELAAVYRWQKQILTDAAEVLAGQAAQLLVEAEQYAVNGPLPFDGVVADSVAPISRGLDAMKRSLEALAVFEQCGSKKSRHESRMLKAELRNRHRGQCHEITAMDFPRRLVPPLPRLWMMKKVETKKQNLPEVSELDGCCRGRG